MSNEPKLYHQCVDWTFGPGPTKECCMCNYGANVWRRPRRKTPKPRYTFEEAAARIDICADCGVDIAKDGAYSHCEVCLPAWLDRIAKINAAQVRMEIDND